MWRYGDLCSESPLVAKGHPVQQAVLVAIVADRVVDGGTVVPNGQGVLLPTQSCLELRALEAGEEQGQQGVALLARKAFDAIGEVRVDIDEFPAGYRMRANNRVDHRQVIVPRLAVKRFTVGQCRAVLRPAAVLEAVNRFEFLEIRLQRAG